MVNAILKVQADKSLFWHVVNLYPLGTAMIASSIEKLMTQDKLPCTVQDLKEGAYFSLPSQENIDELLGMGFDIINKQDYLETLQQWVSPRIPAGIFTEEIAF